MIRGPDEMSNCVYPFIVPKWTARQLSLYVYIRFRVYVPRIRLCYVLVLGIVGMWRAICRYQVFEQTSDDVIGIDIGYRREKKSICTLVD